jgi:hypothetical protein
MDPRLGRHARYAHRDHPATLRVRSRGGEQCRRADTGFAANRERTTVAVRCGGADEFGYLSQL